MKVIPLLHKGPCYRPLRIARRRVSLLLLLISGTIDRPLPASLHFSWVQGYESRYSYVYITLNASGDVPVRILLN